MHSECTQSAQCTVCDNRIHGECIVGAPGLAMRTQNVQPGSTQSADCRHSECAVRVHGMHHGCTKTAWW